MMKQTDTDGPEMVSSPASDGESQSHPVLEFVQEHPAMAIAGGIAIGVLAATVIPRRNREFVAEKSSALANALGMTGLMLVREALERVETTGGGFRNIAGRFASPASAEADGMGDNSANDSDLSNILSSLFQFLRGRAQG